MENGVESSTINKLKFAIFILHFISFILTLDNKINQAKDKLKIKIQLKIILKLCVTNEIFI